MSSSTLQIFLPPLNWAFSFLLWLGSSSSELATDRLRCRFVGVEAAVEGGVWRVIGDGRAGDFGDGFVGDETGVLASDVHFLVNGSGRGCVFLGPRTVNLVGGICRAGGDVGGFKILGEDGVEREHPGEGADLLASSKVFFHSRSFSNFSFPRLAHLILDCAAYNRGVSPILYVLAWETLGD